MRRLTYSRVICSLFPPILSQRIRDIIFPISTARSSHLQFSKKSITGSVFSGNTADDHSYRFAVHGFFDWRNIIIANRYIQNNFGDIVEIGANVGTETISYCDLIALKGNVHAFEPLPDNLKALNKLKEQIKNLIIYPNAISNKTANVLFEIPPVHESGIGKIIDNGQTHNNKNTLLIEALPLDSFLEDFKNLCLISIDTEGHEPFVLQGAREVISKFRPAVIIEVSPKLLKKYANSTSQDILAYFSKFDYHCFIIDRYTLKEIDIGVLNSKKSQNWICIPSEKAKIAEKIKQDLLIRTFIPWYFLKSLKSKKSN